MTGVKAGVTILHATAPGYSAGTTAVAVIPNFIVLQVPFNVGVGQSVSFSIQLVPAAPAGGLTVTLLSSDTTKVKIATPTVTFAAGPVPGERNRAGRRVQVLPPFPRSRRGYAVGATVATVT